MIRNVRRFDALVEDIGPLHALYQHSLAKAVPAYSLPIDRFRFLFSDERCRVFVATDFQEKIAGLALTSLIRSGSESCKSGQHLKGSLVLLIIDPAHQNKGIGSALHDAALDYLRTSIRPSLALSDPVPNEGELQLGSIFPRFFPGVPDGLEFEGAIKWFTKRGWKFSQHKSIDLHRGISPGEVIDIESQTRRARENGITFRSPKPEEDEELYDLQRSAFDTFTGWPDAFPALINSGHREDVWCAYNKDGKLIGATVAALPPSPGSNELENPFHASIAFPSVLGQRCGAIACVGVSPAHQKLGAGIALVATALRYLAERGADGCFIDWVHLEGFYEKMGFGRWERGYWEAGMTVST